MKEMGLGNCCRIFVRGNYFTDKEFSVSIFCSLYFTMLSILLFATLPTHFLKIYFKEI